MAATQVKVVFATQNPEIQLPEEKRQLVVPSGSFPSPLRPGQPENPTDASPQT